MWDTIENGEDCGKLVSTCKVQRHLKSKNNFLRTVCVCVWEIKYIYWAISVTPGLYQYFINLLDNYLFLKISFLAFFELSMKWIKVLEKRGET